MAAARKTSFFSFKIEDFKFALNLVWFAFIFSFFATIDLVALLLRSSQRAGVTRFFLLYGKKFTPARESPAKAPL